MLTEATDVADLEPKDDVIRSSAMRSMRLVLLSLSLLWPLQRLLALNPDTALSQYAHTAWRLQDGLLSSPPTAIAQTRDGYIWIGTLAGLLRFDGVTFTPWQPPAGQPKVQELIVSLLGASDGSLWIGTNHDFARWDGTKLIRYALQSPERVNAIAEGRNGEIWLARQRQADQQGSLCHIVELKASCIGASEGNPIPFASGLATDSAGTVWLAGASSIFHYAGKPVGSYSLPDPSLQSVSKLSGIDALSVDPRGGVWLGLSYAGPGLGLEHMKDGKFASFRTAGFDSSRLKAQILFNDRNGSLWIGTVDDGVYRIDKDRVEHYGSNNGLSSDDTDGFLEDSEGNIWVFTTKGIDRFRDLSVVTYSLEQHLSSDDVSSVLANNDGSIWSLSKGNIDVLRGDAISPLRLESPIPGKRVEAVLRDRDGHVWIGIDEGLYVIDNGRFLPVVRRDQRPLGPVLSLAQDTDGRVWIATIGPVDNLSRVDPSTRVAEPADVQLNRAMRLIPDIHSGIWASSIDGQVTHIRHESADVAEYSLRPKTDPQIKLIQSVSSMLQGADGTVYIWSTAGLTLVRGTESRFLAGGQDNICLRTFSSIFDSGGAMWVESTCGLTRFTSEEIKGWWDANRIPVQDRLVLDPSDGFNASPVIFQPSSVMSADGRLWFGSGNGLMELDPSHLATNPLAPPVQITGFLVDHRPLPFVGGLAVPAKTRDVEIDYAALSFSAPLKVLFKYQLQGRDNRWQSVGTRRQGFFSDLKPGRYKFRVIACNNSGVWNEQGATLDFFVEPAWYQTIWFRVLCVAAAALVTWGIYHLRLRQVATAMSARFDERLAERTRIARELHDTLLQTIQGSKLVATNAMKNADDPNRTRRALEQLSEWLVRATDEGRAALRSLRTSAIETNDLAAGLRRALEDCRRGPSMEAMLEVIGDAREMHPIVRDEVYLIGYEAIRNAHVHSGGTRLDVALTYGQDLSLSVQDNGIGVDPVAANAGKDGHFGLPTMRERAARVGGRLTVGSSVKSGTEVKLVVPGNLAFRRPRPSPFDKVKTLFDPVSKD